MAFKKLDRTKLTFLKPSEMEFGQEVKGRYIEARPDQFGGLGYKVRTETHGDIVVNGCGDLDGWMKDVTPGFAIIIRKTGEEKIRSGKWKGKMAHQFEVEVDDADFEAVPGAEKPLPAGKVQRVTE